MLKATRMDKDIIQLQKDDACLRRIGQEEHTIKFMNGEIWMSPLLRYRAMGDTEDGTGDALEGIRLVHDRRKLMPVSSTAANNAVVLSTTALVDHALKRTQENSKKAWFGIRDDFAEFSSGCATDKNKSFGVIFSASDLIARLTAYANERDLVFKAGLIRYTASVLNTEQYKQICTDGSIFDETLFRKRPRFSNQYEYRFVIVPKQSDIEADIKLPLNEQGFYVANVEPFACTGIQMCMQDD